MATSRKNMRPELRYARQGLHLAYQTDAPLRHLVGSMRCSPLHCRSLAPEKLYQLRNDLLGRLVDEPMTRAPH
jgi:hypothetical protein